MINRVVLIDKANHCGFGLDDLIVRGRLVGHLMIAIAIGGTAQDADLALPCPMALSAARSFKDLCPLVFRDHTLELQQELILRGFHWRRFDEHGIDAMPRQLLDEKDLIGIFPAQSIGRVDQDRVQLPLGRQIAQPLKAWALQVGTAIAGVFEYQIRRYAVAVALSEVDQRRRLAGATWLGRSATIVRYARTCSTRSSGARSSSCSKIPA